MVKKLFVSKQSSDDSNMSEEAASDESSSHEATLIKSSEQKSGVLESGGSSAAQAGSKPSRCKKPVNKLANVIKDTLTSTSVKAGLKGNTRFNAACYDPKTKLSAVTM